MKYCSLCDRTSKTHRISGEGICSTCEVALIYWKQKTNRQILKRARQIQSFANRMEVLLGNVRQAPKRRRRAA